MLRNVHVAIKLFYPQQLQRMVFLRSPLRNVLSTYLTLGPWLMSSRDIICGNESEMLGPVLLNEDSYITSRLSG